MLRSKAQLKVYPNPYAALDGQGQPVGTVRHDPQHGRKGVVHYVGADLAFRVRTADENAGRRGAIRIRDTTFPTSQGRQLLRETVITYRLGKPATIEHTDYHVQRLQQGELLPADAATAKIAAVAWVEPQEALDAAREGKGLYGRELVAWQANTGELPEVPRFLLGVAPEPPDPGKHAPEPPDPEKRKPGDEPPDPGRRPKPPPEPPDPGKKPLVDVAGGMRPRPEPPDPGKKPSPPEPPDPGKVRPTGGDV